MKTYTGLTFTAKINKIINDTQLNNEKEVIIICDHPRHYQEAFLKHIDALLFTDFYTFNDFLYNRLEQSSIYKLPMSKIQKYTHLKEVLQKTTNTYFSNNTSYTTIKELLQIFNEFSNLKYLDITTITSQKVIDCYQIYNEFMQSLDQNYFFNPLLLQDSIIHTKGVTYYICCDLLTDNQQAFLKSIDNDNDVIVLSNYQSGTTPFEHLYSKYIHNPIMIDNSNDLSLGLFSEQKIEKSKNIQAYSIKQTTPQAEVDTVISHVYQSMIDNNLRYNDFALYYPNEQYASMLQNTLKQMSIPYNECILPKSNSYNTMILFIKFLKDGNHKNFISLLSCGNLKNFNNFININHIKKQWIEQDNIKDELYHELYNYCHNEYVLPLQDNTTYETFSVILTKALKETLFIEDKEIYYNFAKTLPRINNVAINEIFEYIIDNLPNTTITSPTLLEHVYLLSTSEPYAGIMQAKYVYILGNNEGVLPPKSNNTGLLLDIHRSHVPGMKNAYINQCIEQSKLISITSHIPIFLCFSLASATSDGQTLLESTMIKKIAQVVSLTPIDINSIIPLFMLPLHANQNEDTKQLVNEFVTTKNQPAVINDSIIKNHLSVSRLESYNGCPYRYFYNYYVKLYPFSSNLLQANEIGNIIHHILDTFMYLFKSKSDIQPIDYDKIDKEINNFITNNSDLSCKMKDTRNLLIMTCIKRDIYKSILVLQSQISKSLFKISDTEKAINEKYPNYSITGFVDRVDQFQDYVSIIDYKSGTKELDLELAKLGFNIQMLLYMDIILKQNDAKLGGVLYFSTKNRIIKVSGMDKEIHEEDILTNYQMQGYVNHDIVEDIDTTIDVGSSSVIKAKFVKSKGIYKGSIFETDEYNEVMESIYTHIDQLHKDMSKGIIDIHPKGSNDATIHAKVNPCNYCNYRPLCRFDIFYNEYNLVDKGEDENG